MKSVIREFLRWTGKDLRYWMDRIGFLIAGSVKPIKGHPGLFSCDPPVWIGMLSKELTKEIGKRIPRASDENLAVARVLGLLLSIWFYRTGRAKCYDPRRNPKDRRRSAQSVSRFPPLFMEAFTDESMDHLLYPSQEWDPPFPRSARYEPDDAENKRQNFAKGKKGSKK